MQTENDSHEPAVPGAAAPPAAPGKIAWAVAALVAVALVGAAVWGVNTWRTSRAIANVESSLAAQPLPAVQAGIPVSPVSPVRSVPAQPGEAVAPPAAPLSADRLPPLVLPGQQVPAAVLRDLPEWVAAEVAPVQTSGASGDESAAPASPAPPEAPVKTPPRRQRAETAARTDRYGTEFARCPGPGQSGAVECRRAVCSGAARKSAACGPYLE